jgi:hypothetical protein
LVRIEYTRLENSIEFKQIFNRGKHKERKRIIKAYFASYVTINCNLEIQVKNQNRNQKIPCKGKYFKEKTYYRFFGMKINRLSIFLNKNLLERGKSEKFNDENSLAFEDEEKMNDENTIVSMKINLNYSRDIFEFTTHLVWPLEISINKDSGDYLNKIKDNYFHHFKIISTIERQIDFVFTQKSYQLLPSPYSTDCVNYPNEAHNSNEECIQDCLARLEWKYLGCLFLGFETLENFISKPIEVHNNLCRKNHEQSEKIKRECSSECKSNCRLHTYETSIKSYQDENSKVFRNSSRIRIFPREKPFIKYIYTPKMDYNQLIYDLGGIIGLWFGLSVYSTISDLWLLRRRILCNSKRLMIIF